MFYKGLCLGTGTIREVFRMSMIQPVGLCSLSRAIPGYRLVLLCWLGKSNTTFSGSITLILGETIIDTSTR